MEGGCSQIGCPTGKRQGIKQWSQEAWIAPLVLASQTRRSEAVTHLEKAARSSDPAIRAAAQEALQALQR